MNTPEGAVCSSTCEAPIRLWIAFETHGKTNKTLLPFCGNKKCPTGTPHRSTLTADTTMFRDEATLISFLLEGYKVWSPFKEYD